MSLSATAMEEIKKRCREHWAKGDREGATRNFVPISSSLAVKIAGSWGRPQLQVEHAWIRYMAARVDPSKVVVPRPYALIEDDPLTYLLMDNIPGETIEERLQGRSVLSDVDANTVCDAYLELRTVAPEGDQIVPGRSWPVQGHLYKPDAEGSLTVQTRQDFLAYMDDRLTRANDGVKTILPRTKYVFNHGDISPTNVKRLPDGRIAFLDFGMAVWGPDYWDAFMLTVAPYELGFVSPMRNAFDRRGLTVDPQTCQLLYEFMLWHGKVGKAVAR